MSEISAARVKELREKTGAGMMDCKNALVESGGDLEIAVDWLRKKGLAAAAKKAGRVASEGLIGAAVRDGIGALLEVNAETDFVARNETFQEFVRTVAGLALDAGGDVAALKDQAYPGGEGSVADQLTTLIATIGENMSLRRTVALQASPGIVASYIHNAAAPELGRIGVLVSLESDGDQDKLRALGKQLAMHVAANNPQSLTIDTLDPAALDRERTVLAEQARDSGKPEEIIDKMVEGRLRKFYEEVVLLEQPFVMDDKLKVAAVLENAAGDVGASVKIAGYARYALGEGIEKETDDFAAEVASLTG